MEHVLSTLKSGSHSLVKSCLRHTVLPSKLRSNNKGRELNPDAMIVSKRTSLVFYKQMTSNFQLLSAHSAARVGFSVFVFTHRDQTG